MRKSLILIVGAAVALAGAALAQEVEGPFHAQIEARKGIMQFNGLNLGVLGGMAKGDIPYDAAAAQAAADNLAATAGLNMMILWPAGSDNTGVEATRALPALWTAGADVGAKLSDLRTAVAAMQAAAGVDAVAIQAAMGGVGGACGACHKAYRAEE